MVSLMSYFVGRKLFIEATVSFDGGKAVKVNIAWGSIEAPVAKTAIWSATAVDANFAAISNGAVKEMAQDCA